MRNTDTYLSIKHALTDNTSVKQTGRFRSCKAWLTSYENGVKELTSYSTDVAVYDGRNTFYIQDCYCSATTWQHVNKFIRDMISFDGPFVVVYLDNTRSDKTYIFVNKPNSLSENLKRVRITYTKQGAKAHGITDETFTDKINKGDFHWLDKEFINV